MRQTRIWQTFLLTASLLLIAAVPASAETLRETFEATYTLKKGASVSISNTNGSLEIASWEGSELLIEATKEIKALGMDRAREAMAKLVIDIKEDARGLTIETTVPSSDSGWMSRIFGREVQAKVSYRLRVPQSIAIEARTVNGNVIIEAVDGEIDARTTNGQIRITDARANARAETTNGSISAHFLRLDPGKDLAFRTTNGSITVWVPADIECKIAASTVNGTVQTDFPINVVASHTNRKKLEGEINGGAGGTFDLRTVNGSIQLRQTTN